MCYYKVVLKNEKANPTKVGGAKLWAYDRKVRAARPPNFQSFIDINL